MARTGLGVEMGAGVGHRAADAHLNTPFHSDRLADKWYAGQPIDVGESVAQVIDRFSPRSVPADQWGRIKGLVRDSVKKAAPVTAHSAEADVDGGYPAGGLGGRHRPAPGARGGLPSRHHRPFRLGR